MAISQGSNLINVVVHNSADSCSASLNTIILSHVLIERKKCWPTMPQISFRPCVRVLRRLLEAGYIPNCTQKKVRRKVRTGSQLEEPDRLLIS